MLQLFDSKTHYIQEHAVSTCADIISMCTIDTRHIWISCVFKHLIPKIIERDHEGFTTAVDMFLETTTKFNRNRVTQSMWTVFNMFFTTVENMDFTTCNPVSKSI